MLLKVGIYWQLCDIIIFTDRRAKLRGQFPRDPLWTVRVTIFVSRGLVTIPFLRRDESEHTRRDGKRGQREEAFTFVSQQRIGVVWHCCPQLALVNPTVRVVMTPSHRLTSPLNLLPALIALYNHPAGVLSRSPPILLSLSRSRSFARSLARSLAAMKRGRERTSVEAPRLWRSLAT